MKRLSFIRKKCSDNWIHAFFVNQHGVTSIEYAVIVAGIAAIMSILFANDGVVGNSYMKMFDQLSESLQKWVTTL